MRPELHLRWVWYGKGGVASDEYFEVGIKLGGTEPRGGAQGAIDRAQQGVDRSGIISNLHTHTHTQW